MSICVRPYKELLPEQIAALNRQLVAYYKAPPASYYANADRVPEEYSTSKQPFHCDLVNRVERGMRVLELGCGTAHLCGYIQGKGAHYTGMDYSEDLLEMNRSRYPGAEFFALGGSIMRQFDLVASLYTIEHVVDPPAYLNQLWESCKDGGAIVVICPEFVDTTALPPSFYYGSSARRLRQKMSSLSIFDAAAHLWELTVVAPRWKAAAQASAAGEFWINLRPRMLTGVPYTIDSDAVHLPRLRDIQHWFEMRGGTVVQTSQMMSGVPEHVLVHNCYIVVTKSQSAAPKTRSSPSRE